LIAIVIALFVRAFVIGIYYATNDAVSPEIPRGSRVLVFKLARSFKAKDIVVYKSADKNLLGRVVAEKTGTGFPDVMLIERQGRSATKIPRHDVIGKVIFNTRVSTDRTNNALENVSSHTNALTAVKDWLKLIDNGDYAQSWKVASHSFRRTSQEDWIQTVEMMRQPLGKLVSRKLISKSQTKPVVGLADTASFNASFESSFDQAKNAVETIVFTLAADGQWKAAAYVAIPVAFRGPQETQPPLGAREIVPQNQNAETPAPDASESVELQKAKENLEMIKQKVEHGLVPCTDYENAKIAVDIAEAELNGDSIAVARLKLQAAELKLKTVADSRDLGKATDGEYQKAKFDRDIAAAEYSQLTRNTDARIQGKGSTLDEQSPVVVETFPVSGARAVEPGETEIRVRFSKEMADGSWSWVEAWNGSTPKTIGKPKYEADHKTCVLKVKLEPARTYAFWLNPENFKGFTDADGRAAIPYLLIFQIKQK
jgi:RNA polymerase sigma-70 factor (ECF subfamily)